MRGKHRAVMAMSGYLGGLTVLSALSTGVGAQPVTSAPPAAPGAAASGPSAGELTISAREQPIGAFLRDLFGRAGRPVVPSPNLSGTVNGVFRGNVAKIWGEIGRAFNLVGYDDGGTYYVYTASEVTSQTLAIGREAAQRAVRVAQAQGLPGGRNRLRIAGDGSLVASGVPRFVEQIAALARPGVAGPASGGGGGGGGGYGLGPLAPPPIQPLEFRVFYLRYAQAEDTVITAGGRETRLPGLATIVQNLVLDQRPGGSALTPSFGARPVRQSQPRLGGLGLGSVAPDQSQTAILSQPSLSASDVLGGAEEGGGLVAPLSQDIVRIEPSPQLNALIVRDVPERMAAYDGLIRALDVEPQIVEIEATIIDVDTTKLRRLGINWRVGSGGFGALFGNGTASDNALLPNFGLSRRDNVSAITPSAVGGTISTIIGGGRQFLARITALESQGAARIVQRPQIVTLANTEAVFDRTQTFYVRVAGRQQVDLFNVTAGTVLRVNPHVFRDRDQTRIRMSVQIEDGNINGTVDVDNIPIIERSSVATQAMVVDGESLLLGGMTADSDINNVTRVPLLGKIPLLGELFKFRQRERAHTERLFLITPRLVSLDQSRSLPPAVPAGTVPTGALPPEATRP